GVRRSDGYSGSVYALALYEGDLVIGGSFVSAGTQQALSVARWNGQEWRPMGNGAGEHVYALAVYNGDLYAGGRLTDAIGDPEIARWDAAAWIPVPGGGSDIQ